MTTVTVVMMCLMILRKIGRPFEIKADLSNTSGQSKTVISESKYIMWFFLLCLSTTSYFYNNIEKIIKTLHDVKHVLHLHYI